MLPLLLFLLYVTFLSHPSELDIKLSFCYFQDNLKKNQRSPCLLYDVMDSTKGREMGRVGGKAEVLREKG